MQASYDLPPTIMQMHIEPLPDYQCPEPTKSYKIKVRVISKIKGLPANYNEHSEDAL